MALDDEEEAVDVVLDDATRTQPRGWSSRAGIVEAEKRERRAKARSEEVKKKLRFFFFGVEESPHLAFFFQKNFKVRLLFDWFNLAPRAPWFRSPSRASVPLCT